MLVTSINLFAFLGKRLLIDCCKNDWHTAVINSDRCHHYSLFKSLLNVEKYLTLDINIKYKIALARFRLANHKLNIELGRHYGLRKDDRVCLYCQQNQINVIDCEYHAFFQCPKYDILRHSFLFNWYVNGTSIHDFYNLLTSQDTNIIKNVALYVYHLINAIETI